MLMILLSALESDGDRQKFITLYEEHHARMERTVMRILKEQFDAEDATVYYELEEKVKNLRSCARRSMGIRCCTVCFPRAGLPSRCSTRPRDKTIYS